MGRDARILRNSSSQAPAEFRCLRGRGAEVGCQLWLASFELPANAHRLRKGCPTERGTFRCV
jgi:hypothetical protein